MTSEMRSAQPSGPMARGQRPFDGIWWLVALRGLSGILFGVIAMLAPGVTILSLAVAFAVYLMADGAIGLLSAVIAGQRGERWDLLVAESLVNLLIGAVLLPAPEISVLGLMLVIAAWAIVTGALMIGSALSHRRDGKAPLVIGGLTSVVFGILLAIGPLIGAVLLTWWLGLYALVFGMALTAFGLRLRAIAME